MIRILFISILLLASTAEAKYWNGSGWVDTVAKRYSGSAWVDVTEWYYNGSSWVQINTGGGGGNSDTFDRADGALGGNWLAAASPLADVAIVSNAVSTTGDWNWGAGRYSTSTADKSVIVAAGNTPSGTSQVDACVRMGAATDGYCARLKTPDAGNWTEWEVTKNGTWICDGTGISYAQNTNHTLDMRASGTSTVTLTFIVDSTTITSTCSDSSSPIASGNPGFQLSADGSTRPTINSWQDN